MRAVRRLAAAAAPLVAWVGGASRGGEATHGSVVVCEFCSPERTPAWALHEPAGTPQRGIASLTEHLPLLVYLATPGVVMLAFTPLFLLGKINLPAFSPRRALLDCRDASSSQPRKSRLP